MFLLALFAEIIALWALSRYVVQTIFTFLMLLFPSRAVAVSLISAILFPGTILHELSHLFTASVLGVKTGKMELVPEHIADREVKTGSVAVAQSDPIRRTLIGVAPLLWGFFAVTAISWFLSDAIGDVTLALRNGSAIAHPSLYIALGGLYLAFAVSNTMIPSRVDMKGTPLVFGVIVGLIITAYFVGLRFTLTDNSLAFIQTILQNLIQSLMLVVGLNIALLLVMKCNIYLVTKLLRIRLVVK